MKCITETENLRKEQVYELMREIEGFAHVFARASAARIAGDGSIENGRKVTDARRSVEKALRATLAKPVIAATDEARVKLVYEILVSDEAPPDPANCWEGWVARKIIAALATEEPTSDDVRDAVAYRRLNTPEIKDFVAAVQNEALHQRHRWRAEHDVGKTDADWFWLIGYLAGKAMAPNMPVDKQLHHIITTAAACLNWHAARVGAHTGMRPGIDTSAESEPTNEQH